MDGVEAPGADGGAPTEDTAALEAAFAETLAVHVLSMSMNIFNDMKTEMAEMEREMEE
jgi:hypothetical protein